MKKPPGMENFPPLVARVDRSKAAEQAPDHLIRLISFE
jgi:hypothetical protein